MNPLIDALRRVAEAAPERVALESAGERISYADLAGRLTGSRPEEPRERRVLPVTGRAGDVAALLDLAHAGHSVLVLDGAGTAWESERAAALFRPAGGTAVLGLCTSGTSGLPQVVELDWDDVLANARAFADAAGFGDTDVLWCSTPLQHRYCLAAGVLGGLMAGSTVLLRPGLLGPGEFTARLLGDRVTVLLSVPFLYRFYVEELARDPSVVAEWSVRRCIAAGEPLAPALSERWHGVTGIALTPHYGSTEDGQVTLGRGQGDEGVGRAIGGIDLAIGDGDELLVRRRLAGGWTPWRATGDTARLDTRGNVHLTGRSSERLNVAGRKVDPVEVEQVLREHPRVADAVVAGVSGPVGQEIAAFLVVDGEVTDRELRGHLGAVLSAHKVPRRFVRIAEVPRTQTGKPRRGLLVADLLADGARR